MKNNRFIYFLITILAIWLAILTLNQKTNANANKEEATINKYNVSGFSTDFTKVIENVDQSIVTVSCENSVLSGFIYKQVEDKVYIITAFHGIDENSNISITFDSSLTVNGSLIGKDIYSDIALIEVSLPYQVNSVVFGDSTQLSKGEMVISIGTPLSLQFKGSVQLGMIANSLQCIENSIIFDEKNYKYYGNYIELSSNLIDGYSGSAIINMNGEIVGVTTMAYKDEICLAIPSNEVTLIADQLIQDGDCHKIQLGIMPKFVKDMKTYAKTNLNISLDSIEGMYIEQIKTDSLASIAGLKVGDIITAINGTEINDYSDYLKIVYSDINTFEFKVLRDGQQHTFIGIIND